MANGKTKKFYLHGIGKEMRRRFIAVNLRLKLLVLLFQFERSQFSRFFTMFEDLFVCVSRLLFLLSHLSRSRFATVDPSGKINSFESSIVISGRSLLVFS